MIREDLVSAAAFSTVKQLAFGLLIFERMLPSLVTFSRETGFDISCCLKARATVWNVLQGGRNDAVDQALAEACLDSAPDTVEFSHSLTSSALNAVLAVCDLIEFVRDSSIDRIINVSTLATDSVYLHLSSLEVADVSSSEEDKRIWSDALMQQELRQQAEDLKFLASLPGSLEESAILALKARANGQPPMFR